MARCLLEKTAKTELETDYGVFDFVVYREKKNGKEHIMLIKPWRKKPAFVRLHSECATGDLFGSRFCDCGQQLRTALKKIGKQGGVLVYLRQEGRGLGLSNKILAYELQVKGADTAEANLLLGRGIDERSYELAVEMLRDVGIKELKLLTNNPQKIAELRAHGFIVEAVPLKIKMLSERGKKYLKTKRQKFGHLL
jgi:3,4-dihydroxy 2-butanone 4-phosphate synthase/GTP cyclohydrolase II